MPPPPPLYIPCGSLDDEDVRSLVRLALSTDVSRVDTHGARRTALKYLLQMRSVDFDLSAHVNADQWPSLEKNFAQLSKVDLFKKDFALDNDDRLEEFWELTSDSPRIHPLAKKARQFTNGEQIFAETQIKVYFNARQLKNIPHSQATFSTSGFVDEDCRASLRQNPLETRHNRGDIHTKRGRIEQVIFDIPTDKQIIVLDFADERMPGGLFLYGATTQEETICYHSNLYRALLDLKYGRFQGGFLIPEFGCVYVQDVQFSLPPSYAEKRHIDVIAAACYDLTGEHGLHRVPASDQAIETNTRKKLEAIIAAAQANAKDNGKNTYLLLGPIGCGAFHNKIENIARLWQEVLSRPLNTQTGTQQRHAFEQIWFISGTDHKLQIFENAFQLSVQQRL